MQSHEPVCTLHVPSPPHTSPTPVSALTPGQLFSQTCPQYPGMQTHVESVPTRSSSVCVSAGLVKPEHTPFPRSSTIGTPQRLHCPSRSWKHAMNGGSSVLLATVPSSPLPSTTASNVFGLTMLQPQSESMQIAALLPGAPGAYCLQPQKHSPVFPSHVPPPPHGVDAPPGHSSLQSSPQYPRWQVQL